MNFLGTPQLRAGVNVLFFFKVSFLKHPNVQHGTCEIQGQDKVFSSSLRAEKPLTRWSTPFLAIDKVFSTPGEVKTVYI